MANRKPTGRAETDRGGDRTGSRSAAERRQADSALIAALNHRAALALEWARLSSDSQVADAGAEASSLSASTLKANTGPLSDACLQAIYRELMSGCRAQLEELKVAYLGPPYSFSHQAAIERFGQSAELIPVASVAAVFQAVQRGDVRFGVVPIENSTDGRIADSLQMFSCTPVRISGEVRLRIHHYLLGRGVRADVREVHSKPQALSQCRQWLTTHLPQAKCVETSSTTAAAETAVSRSDVAAIASQPAGVQYGLKVLASCVEDNPHNVTRFAIIGQQSAPRSGQDRTAVMFQLAHEPGALADSLAVFKRNRLNLTWVESFPRHRQEVPPATATEPEQEYFFVAELEGHETDLRVRRALTALRRKARQVEVLGSYAHAHPVG